MNLQKRLAAEFVGTFWLVFGGCGSAVLAAAFPALGIGFVGVSLAFGLTVLTMAFAIGHISGCHPQPCCLGRTRHRQAISRVRAAALCGCPGPRWHRRECRALRHRQRQARLRPGRLCDQWLRRELARRILHDVVLHRGAGPHLPVPAHHSRFDRRPRPPRDSPPSPSALG